MENYTEKLYGLVKQVTEVYKQADGLKAMAVGASVSKDRATRYSDLDIIMIWDELPEKSFFEKAYHENGGERRYIHSKSENGMLEIYYVKNVECQFSHQHFSFYEDIVKQLQAESLEKIPHLIGDGFLTVKPLYGEDYIQSVKDRLSQFPEGLRKKMVERYLRFGPFDELRYRFQKTENIIWNTDVISIYVKRLLSALLGLNRMYIPGDFRKVDYLINKMKHKPENLYQRILDLYSGRPVEILDKLYELTREVFDLVEKHLPEFAIAEVRAKFMEPEYPADL